MDALSIQTARPNPISSFAGIDLRFVIYTKTYIGVNANHLVPSTVTQRCNTFVRVLFSQFLCPNSKLSKCKIKRNVFRPSSSSSDALSYLSPIPTLLQHALCSLPSNDGTESPSRPSFSSVDHQNKYAPQFLLFRWTSQMLES